MHRPRLTRLLLAFVSLTLIHARVLPAHGQNDACEKDRQKYCPMHGPKDPLRLYCLKTIESQVSFACKSMLRDVKGSPEEVMTECRDDYHSLCSEVIPGDGRILKCLKSNSTKLSFECRKKVNLLPNS